MTHYIILLRGVMPSGKNAVPMAPLRLALEKAGLHKVRTYIQSGNVLAHSELAQADIETLVHEVIAKNFGGDITVLAREPAYFKRALSRNPFKQGDPAKLYYTLMAQPPEKALLKAFNALDFSPDQFKISGDMLYAQYDTRYSDSKLNNATIERKLALCASTRVHNTIVKLVELAREQ